MHEFEIDATDAGLADIHANVIRVWCGEHIEGIWEVSVSHLIASGCYADSVSPTLRCATIHVAFMYGDDAALFSQAWRHK